MTPEQAKTVADFLVPMLTMESRSTNRVLSAVPDDKASYRPADKNMSAEELAAHLGLVEIWFLEGIVNGEFAVPGGEMPKPKPSEVAALHREKVPALIEQIKQLSGEHLAKTAQFYTFNLPIVQYIQFSMVHSVHHRGQLSVYLRPMGAKVPAIYGSSADEAMEAAAQA